MNYLNQELTLFAAFARRKAAPTRMNIPLNTAALVTILSVLSTIL
ncbi:MAG: hypothetical protein SP1CHLAM54_10390 [Chlamydiia bacterium]|nr:hypothetical protein [Chlamydiia bacterium]MCH9615944.1 hypothetical protein [Chlamydiia bacterium]MCH9628653.1 hypothetical protein [Chlamydiia bacterium]